MKNGSTLEKLSVRGFKSFAKQTSLIFSPGITAIVGPNGSGKSNVLDALSFVMGSLSFSSLRAKSAENLLYFGKIKKSSDAEVELAIKSENYEDDGTLRLHRKLSKDGTSVYRINGKKSTRLAILDTLASINMFPDSHNIVHQGDITKFINMSPKQRKEFIDVVAGIELYERKKTKAMTDLENVEIKIEKVEAIHGERVRVFNQLKEEREKVKKFNELKALEEQAKYSLLLKEIEEHGKKMDELAEEKQLKKDKISQLNKNIEEKMNELLKVNSSLEKKGMREKVEAMTSLERLKMDYEKSGEEILRNLKAVETSNNRTDSIKSQIAGLKRRKTEMIQETESKKKQMENIEQKMIEYKASRDSLTSKMSIAKQAYEKKKNEYEKLKSKKEGLVLRVKELSLEKQSNERILEELKKRLGVENERRLSLESERKKELDEKKQLEKEVIEIETSLKKVIEKLKKLKRREKEIIGSSSLPEGVRELMKSGYKVLGEMVSDPSEIMPFAFSIVSSNTPKPNKGWAHIIPENFDIEKIKEFSKVGKNAGKMTEYDFKRESERETEIRELQKTMAATEKEMDLLRERRSIIEGKLQKKIDSSFIARASNTISQIKREISERKKRLLEINEQIDELDKKVFEIGDLKEPSIKEEKKLEDIVSKIMSLESESLKISSEIRASKDTLKNLIEPDILHYEKLYREIKEEIKNSKTLVRELNAKKLKTEKDIKEMETQISKIEGTLKDELGKKSELENFMKETQAQIYQFKSDLAVIEEKKKTIREKFLLLKSSMPSGLKKIENPREVLREVVAGLRNLGTINFKATEEFQEIRNLVEDISERLDKLKKEKDAILALVNEIETQKKKVFMETFNKINRSFAKIFSQVIDGESQLELEGENLSDSGVNIKTQIRGRELPTESLSGGQKTLAAIALVFAIQEVKPSPLYVFDEVGAALDKNNSEKLALMLKNMSKTTQIISITHNDIIVRESDQIVGVYMNKGFSKLVSLPKEKVLKEAESWMSKE